MYTFDKARSKCKPDVSNSCCSQTKCNWHLLTECTSTKATLPSMTNVDIKCHCLNNIMLPFLKTQKTTHTEDIQMLLPKELATNDTIMQWNCQNLSLMKILRVKIKFYMCMKCSANTHINNKHTLVNDIGK